ncbi:MAG: C45 family autoproteolytic acyltransferase/hydrolase [Geminicoccaceae bacterium]
MIEVTFRAVAEDQPGAVLRAQFERTWASYRHWYLRDGEAARPSFVRCRRMLREHLPELLPTWERLVELVGGGDLEARFLSLYNPPAFVAGCTQALWTHRTPALVRNYDYAPSLFDGLILRSALNRTGVVAMADCIWGVLDGINEHGLAVSLAYGGRQPVGDGFAITVVLRYILEFCAEVAEAVAVLKRVPIHVGYNVALIDRRGRHATVFVAPDRPARVEPWLVSANRQAQDGRPDEPSVQDSALREAVVQARLSDPGSGLGQVIDGFLAEPVWRDPVRHGWGTLYTACYLPAEAAVSLRWRGSEWRQAVDTFEVGQRTIEFRGGKPHKACVHAH